MKKILPIITLFFLLFSACSIQEKVSPLIFVERLSESSEDLIFDYENSYYDGNNYIIFVKYKEIQNLTIVMQYLNNNVIKKISLSSPNSKNAYEVIALLISVYSPIEDVEIINQNSVSNKDDFLYFSGNEYTYSMFISEDTIYFEVFNNELNDYSVPELTLKQNDKTEF